MGNEIYVCVSVTEDVTTGSYWARMSTRLPGGELEIVPLPRARAKKLLWELKLAGGEKRQNIIQYNRNLVDTSTFIFIPV